jgi:hypothetical protein
LFLNINVGGDAMKRLFIAARWPVSYWAPTAQPEALGGAYRTHDHRQPERLEQSIIKGIRQGSALPKAAVKFDVSVGATVPPSGRTGADADADCGGAAGEDPPPVVTGAASCWSTRTIKNRGRH